MRRSVAVALTVAVAAALVVPGLLGIQRYVITGGSMGDALPAGSLVFARATVAADARVGDVVTFVPAGHRTAVTHRVVAADGGAIVTRGDANRVADPWRLTPGTRVHRVIGSVPVAGRAVLVLRSDTVVLLALAAAALLLVRPRRRRRRPTAAGVAA